MSNILNSNDFGLKIYNRFPPKYREDDVGQRYALKRYIEALSDGGFKPVIDDINGITHLIDPDNIDAKLLPIQFKQYGLELFNGIPENYLRYLLPRLGEAWSMKGTLGVVEFITSSISGVKAVTEVTFDEKENPYINIRLEMDYSIDDSYFPNDEQLKRLLLNFIPFYCDLGLYYAYMFYESQVLKTGDETLTKIKDIVSDNGNLKRWNLKEGAYSSLFGQAILGKSVFGYRGEDTEECEDHIKENVVVESVSFVLEDIDLDTGNEYNVVNGSRIKYSDSCYSIITINGEQTRIEY